MKANLLRRLRNQNGKIETVWRYGNTVKVAGWTTFKDSYIQVRNAGEKQKFLPLLTRVSERADLQELAPFVYEFDSKFTLSTEHQRTTLFLHPRVRFQRGLKVNKSETCDLSLARQVFDVPTLLNLRQFLPQHKSLPIPKIDQSSEESELIKVVLPSDNNTVIVLPVVDDSNVIHSQLLLLDMDQLEKLSITILVVTENPIKDQYQFKWSSSLQNARVAIMTLRTMTPSQLAIRIKQSAPSQNVLLVSRGYIISSLKDLQSDIDVLSISESDEIPTLLVPRDMYFNTPPAAISLHRNIANAQFPVTPWHDWDFLEFFHSINKHMVYPTHSFIGKPSPTQISLEARIRRESSGQS